MAAAGIAASHSDPIKQRLLIKGNYMFRLSRYLKFKLVSLLALVVLVTPPVMAKEDSAMVEDGKQVSFTYTLTIEDEIIESNTGREPLVYIQGSDQILTALEAELEGMTAGDQKTVDLDAANGYGEVNDEAFQEIPLEQLPEEARVVGAMLQAQGFPGPLRVSEIKEDVALLDFNHPLAGKDLSFDITIVAVEDAPPTPVNSMEDAPPPPVN